MYVVGLSDDWYAVPVTDLTDAPPELVRQFVKAVIQLLTTVV